MGNKNTLYARKCSITGEGMHEGWVVGDLYIKYEKDALAEAKKLGYSNLDDAYNNTEFYWTQWDDVSDIQYEERDGELVDITGEVKSEPSADSIKRLADSVMAIKVSVMCAPIDMTLAEKCLRDMEEDKNKAMSIQAVTGQHPKDFELKECELDVFRKIIDLYRSIEKHGEVSREHQQFSMSRKEILKSLGFNEQ